MPVEDLVACQVLPPCPVVSGAPVLEILPLAQQIASLLRIPPQVILPVVVRFPLHWSDVTVAAPHVRAPIVYAAVVLVRCDAVEVTKRGAVQIRPLIVVVAVSLSLIHI